MRNLVRVGLLAVLFSMAVNASSNSEQFRGEISASQCALNVHSKTQSHKEMIGIMGKDAKECTTMCVRDMGGKYVLLSDKIKQKTRVVYFLDDQNSPAAFAGEQVLVTGNIQADGKTIHVVKIGPAAGK